MWRRAEPYGGRWAWARGAVGAQYCSQAPAFRACVTSPAAFLAKVKERHGIERETDWRRLSTSHILAMGACAVARKGEEGYESVREALQASFGEEVSRLGDEKLPRGYWKDRSNRVAFMEEVGEQLGVTERRWQEEHRAEVARRGGRGLLRHFQGSYLRLLQDTYPSCDFSYLSGMPSSRPRGYWADGTNRRRFMEEVAAEMKVENPGDWKKVTSKHLVELGGSGLLRRYSDSIYRLLADVFPEAEMQEEECRTKMPGGYWTRERRQTLLQEVAERHQVHSQEDWRRVKRSDVEAVAGGGTVMALYRGSVLALLQDTLVDEQWDQRFCRPGLSHNHWQERGNRRAFLEQVAAELRIVGPDGWREVTDGEIGRRGGVSLLAMFGSSHEMLADAFPEEEWLPWRCRPTVPRGFWKEEANVVSFMQDMQRSMQLRTASDWQRLSREDFRLHGGEGLLQVLPLEQAFRLAFPGLPWTGTSATKKRASQRRLLLHTASIFSDMPSVAS